MASERLKVAVSQIVDGEDGDVAFARLFADQCKPCDFRRWYSQVRNTGTCEMGDEMSAKLKSYIDEGIEIDDAFKDHVPDYVGPGEFGAAYTKEVRARKAGKNAPTVSIEVPVVAENVRRRRVRDVKPPAPIPEPVAEVPVSEDPVVEV